MPPFRSRSEIGPCASEALIPAAHLARPAALRGLFRHAASAKLGRGIGAE